MPSAHSAALILVLPTEERMMWLLTSTPSDTKKQLPSQCPLSLGKTPAVALSMLSPYGPKHNLAFLSSDHANKLFREMFPDSEIAKKFSCV